MTRLVMKQFQPLFEIKQMWITFNVIKVNRIAAPHAFNPFIAAFNSSAISMNPNQQLSSPSVSNIHKHTHKKNPAAHTIGSINPSDPVCYVRFTLYQAKTLKDPPSSVYIYVQHRTSRDHIFVCVYFLCVLYIYMYIFDTSISCQICPSSMSIENKLWQSTTYRGYIV